MQTAGHPTAGRPGGGFEPPVYPYDRLVPLRRQAQALPGGVVDLSIGTPRDPPPEVVLDALRHADDHEALRGYPASIGSPELRAAAAAWSQRRLGVEVPMEAVAACVGTKEFVATLPQWLKLRNPGRDSVLYPAVAYPTYAMGAILAGLRAVAVPVDEAFRLDLAAIDPSDAERALVLWVNSPGNPAGQLEDLEAAAAWGRAHDVPVFSDECYVEFTWRGEPATILATGLDGVVALNSLSKRSNLAGGRVGWYVGDPELVGYLREVRKHVGLMVPGPLQAAGAAALAETSHVEGQRRLYAERLERMGEILARIGVSAPRPDGGFYLWVPAPDGDAWAFTERLAVEAGLLVSPGEFYGEAGAGHVRLAMIEPIERLELVAARLHSA